LTEVLPAFLANFPLCAGRQPSPSTCVFTLLPLFIFRLVLIFSIGFNLFVLQCLLVLFFPKCPLYPLFISKNPNFQSFQKTPRKSYLVPSNKNIRVSWPPSGCFFTSLDAKPSNLYCRPLCTPSPSPTTTRHTPTPLPFFCFPGNMSFSSSGRTILKCRLSRFPTVAYPPFMTLLIGPVRIRCGHRQFSRTILLDFLSDGGSLTHDRPSLCGISFL